MCAAQICKDGRILADFQDRIRAVLKPGRSGSVYSTASTDPPAVITLDEVGCGIVPLEKSERDYREAVGHAGQMLAAAAAEVYRMQCGIAARIK
ncbi:MAG: bifunctional adenosylcobinamide kinase/adenosylcobinamide-phosphate guanylyltransferase [Clostridium sp.]